MQYGMLSWVGLGNTLHGDVGDPMEGAFWGV